MAWHGMASWAVSIAIVRESIAAIIRVVPSSPMTNIKVVGDCWQTGRMSIKEKRKGNRKSSQSSTLDDVKRLLVNQRDSSAT